MKAAVVGLGYVGLPLSIRLSQIGINVLAIDKDVKKIKIFNDIKLPFAKDEPNLLEYFQKANKSKKILFTSSYKNLDTVEIIFVCVDTPVINNKPDYKSLLSATKSISNNLGKNQIIILESTLAPKTTEKLVIPQIEKISEKKLNQDFFIAVAPERIRPNYIFKQLTTLPRIVGVSSKKIIPRLKKIYTKITSGDVDFTNILTAEVAKTVENTYRDVQIAFANEIAIACEELGVNVWKVRNLVNKDPYKNIHNPGSGVGGHCLPKDPWLFASSVTKSKLSLLKNARGINNSMPKHILDLLMSAFSERKVNQINAKVAVLGYSYAENSDDFRNSPTETLMDLLKMQKIKFIIQDPYVENFQKVKIQSAISKSDAIIIMVAHDVYKKISLNYFAKYMRTQIIIDGRNLIDSKKAKAAGFLYKGIGNV